MGDIVSIIRRELEQNIDEKTKNNFQRFFKEDVKGHGVKSSIVREIAKKHFDAIKTQR